MRILIADSFPHLQLEELRARGHTVRYEPDLDAETLPASIGDTEILVVRSTGVAARVLENGAQVGLIIRAGAGTNTIDVERASAGSVIVSNVPGENAVAVAELTLGLILALDRKIPDNVAGLRRGRWEKTKFAGGRGLKGRSLGIIGMGAVGLEVAIRANAFGMRLLGLDRPGRDEESRELLDELGVELHPDVPRLLAECDIVTLHVPANADTVGMVDSGFLGQMRDGSWLINTSRGEIVVAADLLKALDDKGMWAGLDVFPDEPEVGEDRYKSDLAAHPRVYGTHHIGASTEQAQEAIAGQVVEIVDAYQEGSVRNAVNLAEPMSHTTVIGIRHVDQVGVLSAVFSVLRRARLNVEHMENHIFSGAAAAKAIIHVHGDFTPEVRDELESLDAVFHVGVLRGGR